MNIWLIASWIIIISISIILIPIFYPKFEKWLKTGNVSYLWLFVIIFGLFVFLTYPYFFNLWALHFLGIPESELKNYTELGPIGDIYGSLNAFISSIVLCAVAYTARLQFDASKEMRKESFRNMFYTLLERNREIIKSIILDNDDEKRSPASYFGDLSDYFTSYLEKNADRIGELTMSEVKTALREFVKNKNKPTLTNGFYSSFKNYKSLLNFVKNEKLLSDKEKKFYLDIIRSSMYYGEKKALFWLAISTSNNEYKECLKDTNLLDFKIKPEASDKPEDKQKKERIIKIAQQFGVDKTVFKSSYAFDEYNKKTDLMN